MWSPRSILCPLPSVQAVPAALHPIVRWAQRLDIPLHVTPWPQAEPADRLIPNEAAPEALLQEQVQAVLPEAALDLRTQAWSQSRLTIAEWQAYVAHHDIDLVVLTPPTGGAPSPLLSVPGAESMIAGVASAVLTLPRRTASESFTHVLAPTDLSEEAVPTLHHAEAMACFTKARLDVLHVLTRRQYVALTPADMLALDDAAATPRVAARRLRTWYHRYTHPMYNAEEATELHVKQGDPVGTITRVARSYPVPLIVLAATHHPTRSNTLSTLTENVLRRTTCAMLLTRPRDHSLVETVPHEAAAQNIPS
ncbi:hypothetical protein CRI93_04835 [Longimonas halophila]|uniref:UspA domain-containing protein n=1 Tax=Longimonas halophila TaxID=1469170 RepID=A0A2H3P2Q2_9BACT|nr:universal stress protein [Longimonas halophila]PEN08442.1 hypothetical protein CRI93_04835 [Longimonas halophila]